MLLEHKLIEKLQAINTEDDLRNKLNKRPQLHDIPLVVKQHLGLE